VWRAAPREQAKPVVRHAIARRLVPFDIEGPMWAAWDWPSIAPGRARCVRHRIERELGRFLSTRRGVRTAYRGEWLRLEWFGFGGRLDGGLVLPPWPQNLLKYRW